MNFKKEKMKLLTNEQEKSYRNIKMSYILRKRFEDKHAKYKKYCKVRDHRHCSGGYRSETHIICTLKYGAPKEIPIVFRYRSNYDNYFMIKELEEEFEGNFTCLGENTEKGNLFSSNRKRSYKN